MCSTRRSTRRCGTNGHFSGCSRGPLAPENSTWFNASLTGTFVVPLLRVGAHLILVDATRVVLKRTNKVKDILGDVRLTSALAEQGRLADLTLPDAYCCVLDEHDAQFLDACCLNSPSDVSKLVQAYPLRTVLTAMKLFLRVPDDHKLCARLRFKDVNHLCPVRNAGLFDLIALVRCSCFPFWNAGG